MMFGYSLSSLPLDVVAVLRGDWPVFFLDFALDLDVTRQTLLGLTPVPKEQWSECYYGGRSWLMLELIRGFF